MNIIEQNHEIMDKLDGNKILKKIELCGRICYKSENKIDAASARKFVKNIIKRGHESVLEHFSFSVRFITDRSVTHELVRSRIASYSQESQRYVAYDQDVTFIKPVGMNEEQYHKWLQDMVCIESMYYDMRSHNASPQIARAVLPNSTKTEIIVTANLREWRHIFKLRCSRAAHPQIRQLMTGVLLDLKKAIPVVFDDIEVDVNDNKN